MRFLDSGLADAFVIELEPFSDERGFFARSFCQREFEEHGLDPCVAQCNISYNRRRGTLRGMHYAEASAAEAKLVRCTAGAVWDAIVDLRPDSPTHLKWVAFELSAENRRMLYVPKGFGHGFVTLRDDTEVFYQMSEFYVGGAHRGFRYDDPRFAIAWPLPVSVISEADRNLAPFDPEGFDG
ncbi:MAG: dTDP-4-dehydrorhamnose 3,5-epimerase [Myxococcota bacterium]